MIEPQTVVECPNCGEKVDITDKVGFECPNCKASSSGVLPHVAWNVTPSREAMKHAEGTKYEARALECAVCGLRVEGLNADMLMSGKECDPDKWGGGE